MSIFVVLTCVSIWTDFQRDYHQTDNLLEDCDDEQTVKFTTVGVFKVSKLFLNTSPISFAAKIGPHYNTYAKYTKSVA